MVLGTFSVRPNDLSVRILSLPGVTSHSVVMKLMVGVDTCICPVYTRPNKSPLSLMVGIYRHATLETSSRCYGVICDLDERRLVISAVESVPRPPWTSCCCTLTWISIHLRSIVSYDTNNSLGFSDVACRGGMACVMLYRNIRRAQPAMG